MQKLIRPVEIIRNFTKYAEGSVLISCGNTKVLCTASVDETVPNFLKNKKQGWITAEYSMLPRATLERTAREAYKGKQTGRTIEIQRLIGRCLRACVDLKALGERTITIDCDVLQADGGTRCAAITGACIALHDAVEYLVCNNKITKPPMQLIAAVSVGYVKGQLHSDLCYEQDSKAEVDMNVVMLENGNFVEIQGTAEGKAFSNLQLQQMLERANLACSQLFLAQKQALTLKQGE